MPSLTSSRAPRRGRRLALVIGLLAVCGAPPMADAAPGRLAVVLLTGNGAAPLEGPAARHLLPALQQQHGALRSTVAYLRAASQVHVDRAHLLDPEAVILTAQRAAVRRILFLRSTADPDLRSTRDRRRMVYALKATLLDGDTGEELFSRRYPLATKKIAAALLGKVLADVAPALRDLRVARVHKPHGQLVAPPLEPLPQAYRPEVAYGQGELDPRLHHIPFGSRGAPAGALPRPAEAAPAPAVSDGPADLRAHRPPLRLGLAPGAYTRESDLLTRRGLQPPAYRPPPGVGAPIFLRFELRGEIYPFAFVPADAWYEGWGGHFQVNLGAVRTRIPTDPDTGELMVTHAVGGGGGGLQYRWVLWHGKWAPDLTLKAGGARYAFPLSKVEFPGVGYTSPYAGGSLVVPLLPDLLELFADGAYQFRVIGLGDTRTLGVQITPGWAYEGTAGLRLTVLDHLQFYGAAQTARYNVPFYGLTSLPAPSLQYGDVVLRDLYWAVLVGMGFVL